MCFFPKEEDGFCGNDFCTQSARFFSFSIKRATTKKKGEPMVDSVRNYYVKLNPSNAGVARMKRVFDALETRRKSLFGR